MTILVSSSVAAPGTPKNSPPTSKVAMWRKTRFAKSEGQDLREPDEFDLSNSIDEFRRSGS